MKSPLTREQAVAAANRSLLANDALARSTNNWGEAFVAQCEAIGVTFETPQSIERDAFKFIHDMSGVWSRTNPGAVAEDMKLAGYIITRGQPR